MNAAKRTKRVALYVRVSTDHQTIKNQERELEAVAERHGWTVVAIFKDQGISGAKGRDERPGLDKLLQAVAPRGTSRDHFQLSVKRLLALVMPYLKSLTYSSLFTRDCPKNGLFTDSLEHPKSTISSAAASGAAGARPHQSSRSRAVARATRDPPIIKREAGAAALSREQSRRAVLAMMVVGGMDSVMGCAKEMGRLIRLSYNGHISVSELTGFIYALDKTRACLESAIAIEANAAKSAPVKPQNITVSIVSIPSGHFIGAEGIAQIESGAYQQPPSVVARSVEDYISNADAQVGANRELNAGIATAADNHGIVPQSPEEAERLAKLNALTIEELAAQAGVSMDDVEQD